jgi:butyrate kinase
MCYSGKHTEGEMKKKLVGRGGLVAHLGTNDTRDAVQRAASGDQEAGLVLDAMIYQIAKEIGAMATVLKGRLDAIVLTGGLAHSAYVTDRIRERVAFLGHVILLPGEDELRALALGALRVLRGEEKARDYPEAIDGAGNAA